MGIWEKFRNSKCIHSDSSISIAEAGKTLLRGLVVAKGTFAFEYLLAEKFITVFTLFFKRERILEYFFLQRYLETSTEKHGKSFMAKSTKFRCIIRTGILKK